jgi:hypothetical protein
VRTAENSARRARRKASIYIVSWGLSRLGTNTYGGEGCHDPLMVRRDMARFFRRLREVRGIGPFPYLWTAEWHDGLRLAEVPEGNPHGAKVSHGLHTHWTVGSFVQRSHIEWAWQGLRRPGDDGPAPGYVHIKRLGNDIGISPAPRALLEARRSARYVGKYLGKTLDGAGGGLHRYEVAQNFAPRCERLTGATARAVLLEASQRLGARPSKVWHSSQSEEPWLGPSPGRRDCGVGGTHLRRSGCADADR